MDVNQRIQASFQVPVLDRHFSRIPMKINRMSIGFRSVSIENTVYKFNRRSSLSLQGNETRFIEISIDSIPMQRIEANGPTRKIMNAFLERVFTKLRPVKIGSLELRKNLTANIKLEVDNLKLFHTDIDYSKILSTQNLKSLEYIEWQGGFASGPADLLIVPNTQYLELLEVSNPRVHVRSLTPGLEQVPPFLMHLVDAWLANRSMKCNHWSFEKPADYIAHFIMYVVVCVELKLEIKDGEFHFTTPMVPGEIFKIILENENRTYTVVMKFEKTN